MNIRTVLVSLSVGLLLGLLSTASTDARPNSYRKNRKHKGFAKKRTFKIQKVKAVKKKAKVVKKRPLQLQAFERVTQQRMQKKTGQQIATLKQLIQASTEPSEKARYYFLLAEHYWENSKYWSFVGHGYDDYKGRPNWPQIRQRQVKAFSTSKAYKKQAAAVYYRIIKNYKNFNRMCEAYYFLGKNLFEMGQEKQGLNVFRLMLQRFRNSYPSCPFIPNAYLSFGEYYFNNNQVKAAFSSYTQVLRFSKSSVFGFALYKVGWCYYNLTQYRKALQIFARVILRARGIQMSGKKFSSREKSVLKEALRDYVVTYSQLKTGAAVDADSDFTRVGGQQNRLKMLRRLGALYRSQGKHSKIIDLYRHLLRVNASTPRVMWYQLYILQATHASGSISDTVAQAQRAKQAVLAYRQAGRPQNKIYKEAMDEMSDQILRYAKYRLYEAQKTQRRVFYAQASRFYRIYLALFSSMEDAYEAMFWMGEINYQLERYDVAGQFYLKAVQKNSKGKYSEVAAYNAVLSYNKLMRKDGVRIRALTNTKKKKRDFRPKPLKKSAKKFLQVCETYRKYFPTSKQSLDVFYKAALTYYFFNYFDKAIPLFNQLIKKHPKHEYAIYSAHYILDTYNIKEDWTRLNAKSWEYYKHPQLGNAKFKREVLGLIMGSGLKTCEAIERKNYKVTGGKRKIRKDISADVRRQQFLAAAKCFIRFTRERAFVRNKRLNRIALYNASLNYNRAGEPDKSLAAGYRLIREHGDSRSDYVRKTTRALATIFASRADFARAADFFERYARKYVQKKERADIFYQAGLLREANGEKRKAMLHYRRVLGDKDFRNRTRRDPKEKARYAAIYMKFAESYKKSGNLALYARMMKDFYTRRMGNPGQSVHARMEYALARQKLGAKREAKRIFFALPRLYNSKSVPAQFRKGRAAYAAAHCAFLMAEEEYLNYTKIKLKANMSQKASIKMLAKKDKALAKASKAYDKVLQYKVGDWGVAALVRKGDMVVNYASFIRSAPTPNLATGVKKKLKARLRARISMNLRQRLKRRPPRALVNKLVRKFMRKLAPRFVSRQNQKYKDAMETRADKIEDSAIIVYNNALTLAQKLNVYNKWTDRVLTKLNKLKASKYPKLDEFHPKPGFVDSDFNFAKDTMSSTK